MSVYCTLPRGGGGNSGGNGSYYHSSIHSPSESGSGSGSSPSSSSSTITSDSSSMLTRQGTISNNYNHSVNPRYQHLQSIKTMFSNINSSQQQQHQHQQQATSSHNGNLNSEDNKSLINTNNHSLNYPLNQQQSMPQHQDYQDYQQQQQQQQYQPKSADVSVLSSLNNYPPIESPVTPGLSSLQGNQFNQLMGLSNSLNMYNNNHINDSNVNTNTGNSTMNSNQHQHQHQHHHQQQQQQHQRQSLQLTLPRSPPEPPQRIYYGLNSFDDLKQIRRNSITSLFEDPPTPNFYGDEDSAYDSTSNESLRLTVKELSKRSNSKKYFTLPTKLGRRLRKSSCPEFNKDTITNTNQSNNLTTTSSTPSPVSDCSPSPKLIFNGSTFPPPFPSSSSSSKPTLLTSSSISSSSSSSVSPTSSISPPSILSSALSSPSSSSSTSDVSVSSTVLPSSSSSLVTEMSYSSPQQLLLHNHHVDDCVNNQNNHQPSSSSTPTSETINSSSPIATTTPTPSANENVCHCCYLLGCHNNQSSTITQSTTAHYQHQQNGRMNPGGVVGINTTANNNISSTGQPSTLETLWEEPSSGHESVRLTEEAIYAAMRELNISLPSKDPVNGQANRNGNSSSWLRANFLKAFRRSKNRTSSKLISSNNCSNNSNNTNSASDTLDYHDDQNDKTIVSRRGSLIMNPDHVNYPSHLNHDNNQQHTHQQHQQQSSSSCYSDEISSKRTSSGPSVASSLVSLPLSCSSSVPPTPPLTPLPSYHSYQHHHHHQQQHQLPPPPPPPQQHQQQPQSQSQLQINDNHQHHSTTLATSHGETEEDVIKELNRQLAEKDQLLQEVCMESINHLNTIESLKELITQLRREIDSLNNQNDQLNAKYSPSNTMEKIKTDFNGYRSNQVNQLTNHNRA